MVILYACLPTEEELQDRFERLQSVLAVSFAFVCSKSIIKLITTHYREIVCLLLIDIDYYVSSQFTWLRFS